MCSAPKKKKKTKINNEKKLTEHSFAFIKKRLSLKKNQAQTRKTKEETKIEHLFANLDQTIHNLAALSTKGIINELEQIS
jgi:hypothetical protein